MKGRLTYLADSSIQELSWFAPPAHADHHESNARVIQPVDRIGPYEIRGLLGHGGMGDVYRAHDPRLGRELALKLLSRRSGDDTALERFVREARAASALNHPNVVTIYEISDCDAGRYIAMELVDGGTLRSLMAERPASELLVRIGAQVARALAVAHEAGIVHRDIKPENIMVRADGLVKVLDFGIARLVSNNDAGFATRTGLVVGTLRYMSPEQACAESVTTASDLFSLGVVLHEMATGQHPFAPSDAPASDVAIVSRMLTAEAPAASAVNPTVPAEIDSLIRRLLDKDAKRRPAAREVETALAELGGAPRNTLSPSVTRGGHHTVGRERERQALRQALAE